MINSAVQKEMKHISTDPPKKKLKQARLPFQILSPGVVKNVEISPSSQCKRKACETASDEDMVMSEINESKVEPIDKKPKVISKDNNNEISDSEGEKMEIDDKEEGSAVKNAKENSKTTSNTSKRISKSTSARKFTGKNAGKLLGNGKTVGKTSKKEQEIVDFIDLSDSPVKNHNRDKESTSNKDTLVPKNEDISKSDDDLDNENRSLTPTIKNVEDVIRKEGDSNQQESDPAEPTKNVALESCKETVLSERDNGFECSNKEQDVQESPSSTSNTSGQVLDVKDSLKKASPKNTSNLKTPKNNLVSIWGNLNQKNQENKSDSNKNNSSPNINSDVDLTSAGDKSSPSLSSQSPLNESNLKTPTTSNDSQENIDGSFTSDCNTSILSTPGSSKKLLKTPRRPTPNQSLKLKEKEERRKERERLKQEKEKKKAEEKEEKLKQKREKEEERLRLKQEKEEEKRKEKEEKEKKKQAELDLKNEEKRLKEEEKRQKEEEKRLKEEEKKKREEEERKKKDERKLKEEQKEAEKRKSAQAFVSFFVKTETRPVAMEEDKENTPDESIFQPFEVKNDMRLAPLIRTQLSEERRQLLDSALEDGTITDCENRLYLKEVRSPSYVRGSAPRTWPPPDDTEDEVIIIESENPNDEMEVDDNEMEKKREKRRQRAKLLQFHENRRPPYWGTWRKRSKHIRPRAPLGQDKTMLEYEVESDDEWEEPEDGESLRGSEDEESQDEQYEEDNDMFVPHGYLSDGEGDDELDDQSPEAMKARLKLLQLEFEAERSTKQEKLKPRLIGCVWICNSESNSSVEGNAIAELFLLRRAVWEGSLPVMVASPLPSSPSTPLGGGTVDTPSSEVKTNRNKRVVDESMIPDLIRKVHGSRKKLIKLMLELLDQPGEMKLRPSKTCLAKKIREIASWEKPAGAVHHCWYVKDDVRQAYGLTDLHIPSPPTPTPPTVTPAANITKFTKVLTTDERLKLLRETPTVNNSPKEALATSLTPTLKTPNKIGKTSSIKLFTNSPVVKKRVPLITVGPSESFKKVPSTSLMNFVTKAVISEGSSTTEASIQKQETLKVEEKAKKRITPITLTNSVSKPKAVPSSTVVDSIVIDD